MTPAISLNQLWARALVEELTRAGVRDAIVCPGSRSAPLALACGESEALRTFSVIDERSAGFFALGLAKASGSPSLLVATSGSAGAHFFPAIIEADASRVPLIVLLADRPPELHDWGAPQTMRQPGLYGNFARWSIDLGVPEARRESFLHLRATAARAVATALRAPSGAVQLNAPFREPLAPIADGVALADLDPIAAHGRDDRSLVQMFPVERAPDRRALDELRERIAHSKRGIILCGPRDRHDGFCAAVHDLGRALAFPIFAEAASQARYGSDGEPIAMYDAILRHEPFARAHVPDLVLRFGGGWTAKGPQAWIDRSGAFIAQISDDGALFDPAHAASLIVEGDPKIVCRELSRDATTRDGSYREQFLSADRKARAVLASAFSETDRLDEPRAAYETARAIPDGATLFVASSMPIRDLDAFAPEAAPIRVLANRGVNGIDGLVSSALGVAAAGSPTVLLCGDLALLHDLGGLVTARRAAVPLTIVVIDNDGGGIFSFLPIARHPEQFERLFGTPHGIDFQPVAALAGARFTVAESAPSLREAIARGIADRGLHLIRVPSARAENVAAHERLFRRIAAALE
jgi:2-succinyl-5-enolpyruvyl-6-hydroxy-3-cyclohexene-1-carboxylate synthase